MMEIGSKHQRAKELKRAEAIIVPENDSAKQNEPKPNDGPEATTTSNNPMEERRTKEQQPDDGLRQKQPSLEQQRLVPDNAPTEPALPKPCEKNITETDTTTERNTGAPTNIATSLDHVV